MKSHLTKTCFFDEEQQIARYDVVRYPQFQKLTKKQKGFFWIPEEVTLTRDARDFKELTQHEQHIFTSNLKRQIVLDTAQGREPAKVFLPICSLPEVEAFIVWWTAFEQIHSESYTHILRNVYSNPSEVFDTILDIPEILACSEDINKYYDALEAKTTIAYDKFLQKKALWRCLNAVNALEGIRFYASFACSWAFAEVGKMEGNAKIIKFIARDENVHLAFTQQLLKILPKEDPDFAKIAVEMVDEVRQIFLDVLNQELEWAKYLFKNGSIIGLNETLLCSYLIWLAVKRASAVGIDLKLDVEVPSSNPLPWTQKWIAGSDVQVAPQEVELSSYIQGGIKKDMGEALGGLSL